VLAAAVLCSARLAGAQELNPRAYLITPVGTNVVNLGYSHLEGDLDLSGATPITDAHASADLTALGLYRGLDFFGRSANLLGGPAMEPQEFLKWQQHMLLGVSLKVVAPTGQYDPTALINLGTNRWSFKPEIGYSQRWDHWVLDAYAAVWFFTENPEFFSHNQYFAGTRSKTQSPVTAFEAHLSYDVRPRLWVSLDANFWSGGETSVNGVANPGTYQRNSRVGVTASIPISARNSIKLSYNDGAYIRYGGNYRSISASWQYGWVGWPQFH